MGFFAEQFRDDAGFDLPSIRDGVGKLGDDVDRAALVSYLRAGNALVDTMEGVVDALTGERFYEGSGGSSLLTDGVWLWRYDLAHYVETYRLWLPLEFIDHARGNSFHVPPLPENELGALAIREREARGADWWAVP